MATGGHVKIWRYVGLHPILFGMDNHDKLLPEPPAELLATLAASEADIAAGRISPWPEARARMIAMIDKLQDERPRRQA
jgi:hypothetical protein